MRHECTFPKGWPATKAPGTYTTHGDLPQPTTKPKCSAVPVRNPHSHRDWVTENGLRNKGIKTSHV